MSLLRPKIGLLQYCRGFTFFFLFGVNILIRGGEEDIILLIILLLKQDIRDWATH